MLTPMTKMNPHEAVSPLYTLLPGKHHMPMLAYGPIHLDSPVDGALIHSVLEAGYRHLVVRVESRDFHPGRTCLWDLLRRERIDRLDVYVTLIIETPTQIHDDVRGVVRETLECLGIKHVDLLLLHSPSKSINHAMSRSNVMELDVQRKTTRATWKLLEKMYKEGVATNIGLSGFINTEIEDLILYTKCCPHVLMVNADSLCDQTRHTKLLSYCKYRDINLFVSLENINNGMLSPHKTSPLADVCRRHQRTPYQLVSRRLLQTGAAILQQQQKPSDITRAFQVIDFGLSEKDVDTVHLALPKLMSSYNSDHT